MPRHRETYKILVLGDENVEGVGKTALVGVMHTGEFVINVCLPLLPASPDSVWLV